MWSYIWLFVSLHASIIASVVIIYHNKLHLPTVQTPSAVDLITLERSDMCMLWNSIVPSVCALTCATLLEVKANCIPPQICNEAAKYANTAHTKIRPRVLSKAGYFKIWNNFYTVWSPMHLAVRYRSTGPQRTWKNLSILVISINDDVMSTTVAHFHKSGNLQINIIKGKWWLTENLLLSEDIFGCDCLLIWVEKR